MRNFALPPLTKTAKYLIYSSAFLFLLDSILGLFFKFSLGPVLGLSWLGQSRGMIFQWFTFALLPEGLWQLVFDSLLLWFLGTELEMLFGRATYIRLIAMSVVTAGITYLLVQRIFFPTYMAYPLMGPGVYANALLVLYALQYPDRQLYLYVFPIPAKYFCLLLIGIQLYSGVFTPAAMGAWGPLGGVLAPLIWWFGRRKGFFSGAKFGPVLKKNKRLSLVKNDSEKDDKGQGPRYWQ
jgi:membrane associated rhomboid family serine protease